MYHHKIIRRENITTTEELGQILFFAVAAMGDYLPTHPEFQRVMFCECMAALENGIGEIHIIQQNNIAYGFCFVYDKYDSDNGARHIHLLSVYKKYRRQGIGRKLMEHVMASIGDEPVTLETQPDSLKFFEQLGFRVKPVVLNDNYIAMYANCDGIEEEFKSLVVGDRLASFYLDLFERIATAYEASKVFQ